ncbi:MAG: ABC transporter permease [Faecalicoccus sp.]|nr:ABC transporter permease [Faecalicoccus sp.]
MFFRIIKGALTRQWKKMAMIAFTVALGTSLATAMLSVMMDVGDKINQELKTYGANITVVPKESSIVDELYDVEGDDDKTAYLREDELGNIKTIFWAFNIVDYTPFLTVNAKVSGDDVNVVGSWFNHHMDLPTGESLDSGIATLRSWWDLKEGSWLDEQREEDENCAMVGVSFAEKHNIKAGDTITVKGSAQTLNIRVVGIFDAGGDEDEQIFVPLNTAQALADKEGKVDSIEVSAITTPDNELSEKAAKDPGSLTVSQYETWYCTAYASSIAYQIQEVITDSVAAPVRQIADSEGAILEKTQLLMILITILSMVGAALGISNLVTASVMERSKEIGLLKALGAQNSAITANILTQMMIVALIGGVIGFAAGFGFAQIIGQTVFGSAINMRVMVIPIVAILIILMMIAGSLPAIRMLMHLKPAEVLHGRQ